MPPRKKKGGATGESDGDDDDYEAGASAAKIQRAKGKAVAAPKRKRGGAEESGPLALSLLLARLTRGGLEDLVARSVAENKALTRGDVEALLRPEQLQARFFLARSGASMLF